MKTAYDYFEDACLTKDFSFLDNKNLYLTHDRIQAFYYLKTIIPYFKKIDVFTTNDIFKYIEENEKDKYILSLIKKVFYPSHIFYQ